MRPLVHRKLLGQLAASAAGLSLAISGAALANRAPGGLQEQSSNQSLQSPLERLEHLNSSSRKLPARRERNSTR